MAIVKKALEEAGIRPAKTGWKYGKGRAAQKKSSINLTYQEYLIAMDIVAPPTK